MPQDQDSLRWWYQAGWILSTGYLQLATPYSYASVYWNKIKVLLARKKRKWFLVRKQMLFFTHFWFVFVSLSYLNMDQINMENLGQEIQN